MEGAGPLHWSLEPRSIVDDDTWVDAAVVDTAHAGGNGREVPGKVRYGALHTSCWYEYRFAPL